MTPEFSRVIPLERITVTHPLEITVEASADECRAVAGRLMIAGVASLRCRFVLVREPARIVADGRLAATVVQDCVVSLEPFEAVVDEAFTVYFVTAAQASESDDPLAPDEIVHAGTAIDVGEAAVEQLALSLDPYPRRPDAALPEPDAADPAPHPFAGLGRLRLE